LTITLQLGERLHDFANFAFIFASDYLNGVTSFDVHFVTLGCTAPFR